MSQAQPAFKRSPASSLPSMCRYTPWSCWRDSCGSPFYPSMGESMKAIGRCLHQAIKMMIAPIILTVVVGIAGMEDMKRSQRPAVWRDSISKCQQHCAGWSRCAGQV